MLCPTGQSVSANICGALPAESCTPGTAEYKPCALDIYSCLASDRHYDFCLDFPSLCPQTATFTSYQHLTQAACSQTSSTNADGTSTGS